MENCIRSLGKDRKRLKSNCLPENVFRIFFYQKQRRAIFQEQEKDILLLHTDAEHENYVEVYWVLNPYI